MATRTLALRNLHRLCKSRTIRHNSTSSSVNPAEVSHFNALASTWWDPHGSSRLLHLMNPLRHDFITSCLTSQATPAPSHKLRYLDVGCGGGIFAESAARLASTAHVTGIDPSAEVIKVALEHARQDPMLHGSERLQYLNKSIEDMPIPRSVEEQYDVLTLFEVVEHIDQPALFLKSCLPFVRPGGWLVLSTIARTWTSWITTKLIAEEVVRLVPRGTHQWEKYVNEEEMRSFFRTQHGWASSGGIKAMGCMYVPGVGWIMVAGGEQWGNYFFGVRKDTG
ncbi:Hexaprenyldihydroxybenzoate methyltransferase, mitochondrial [Lambiella insularis]|nr:Hexaprenyldihydroxybenzoate methyltransferase, mitochondrial [Lambiella insularis]